MNSVNPMLSTALASVLLLSAATFTGAQAAKPFNTPQAKMVTPNIIIAKPKVKLPTAKIIIKQSNASPNAIPHRLRVKTLGPDIGNRLRKVQEAAHHAGVAGTLEGNSGADATIHPAAAADPLMGDAGIQTGDRMDELCKGAGFRRLVAGLGLCAGSADGSQPLVDPKTGEIHYSTESPVHAGGKFHGPSGFDGLAAGDRVPRRDGPASDGPKPDFTADNRDGSTYEEYTETVRNPDGTYSWIRHGITRDENKEILAEGWMVFTGPDHDNGVLLATDHIHRNGEVTVQPYPTRYKVHGIWVDLIHIDDQPGDERGQASGNFRSSFYCLQSPGSPNCQLLKAGFEIDPVNPDGEGRPGTRPQTETPRLGRQAVINPGPADSEIRGGSGGGSLPMDMKDPVGPHRPN